MTYSYYINVFYAGQNFNQERLVYVYVKSIDIKYEFCRLDSSVISAFWDELARKLASDKTRFPSSSVPTRLLDGIPGDVWSPLDAATAATKYKVDSEGLEQ